MLAVASFSSGRVLLISSLLAHGWLTAAAATAAIPNPPSLQSSAEKQSQAVANYGKLPLSFEPNQGQTDPSVKFVSRGSGYALFLTSNGAVLALGQSGRKPADCNSSLFQIAPQPASCQAASPGGQDIVRMTLAGAVNQGQIIQATGEEPLPGKVNYFLGNDPMRWHTDLPTYAKVRYSGVYPGVDLVYYGNQRQLEYDFVVAPGAESSRIHLQFAGANSFQIHIAADGDLVLQGANGEVTFHKPVAYQEKDGRRQLIPASFHLAAANTVGFSLGAYDHSRPLIIDPVLSYSTYLGGSGTNGNGDEGNGIAVDSAGDAYVVGTTYSTNFPVTPVAFQSANNAALAENGSTVFISELNPAGTALLYSTYLGGSGTSGGGDFGYGIALDSANNVYVTGATYSTDFPVTCGAFLTTNPSTASGAPTAFVAELSPTANTLVYSTYLGGSGNGASPAQGDVAQAIAVDSAGDAFVTGYTFSPNFPVSDKPFQPDYAGSATTPNAFVTKLNPGGTALVYSTYLGGSGGDYGNSLAIDASGDAFVAGSTASSNFPFTSGAFQTTLLGPSNGFVTQLNPAGAEEVYSTYLGGGGQTGSVFYAYNNPSTGDSATAIAVDSGGFAYVAGNTTSSNFPVTAGALEGAGDFDAATGFVTKLSLNGSSLVYSTYLEGVGTSVSGLAVDSAGTAYVTGSVPSVSAGLSAGFLATADALPAPVSTGSAAFLVKLSPSAARLNFATMIGGAASDAATAVAVDAAGNAYLTGVANSTNFPTTSGVIQSAKGAAGVANAFISKFSLAKETNQTAYPANPSNVATTMTDDPPDEIVLDCNPYPAYNGFYMGVSVTLNWDLGGPPPTGTITFEDSLNYNFQNYGPYTIPIFGLGWGGGETTFNFSDGQEFGGPDSPFSISWSAAYSGDAYYAASGVSGSVSSPGCPPPSSSVGLAPKEDSRHILMDLRPKQAGAAQDALRSRSEQFSVPGPKFTPRSASAHEDGQRSQAAPAVRNQAAASCLAPVVVATPVFSPASGTYTSAQSVTISDATPGATIYYTTNGTVPTSSSTMYAGAISVSATETIQAIAVATGYPDSAIASATYTIQALAATPTFSPEASSYPTVQFVSVADATPGATIYYTTDGTTPTTSSTKYSGAITVSATETIEAIAVASGYADSAVASATYTILASTTSELQFIPIPACRIADTRNPTGAFGGPELAGGSTRTFNLPQSACGIPSTAVAYSLNATVVPDAALGYLTVWPAGEAQPPVSTLNSDGRVKANATITAAGANGGVSVFTTDSTQFILDIDGYFVPAGTSTSGLEFYPLAPFRVADTRNPTGALGGPFLTGDTSRAFPVQSGSCGIPAIAKAYSLNVTTVPHGGLGYLTVWPTGQIQPGTSTLNAPTGGVTANAAIVAAGNDGEASIFVSDDADVILDVNGYFALPAAGGLSLYTVTPCRALDTRSGSGPFDGTLSVPIHASSCAPPATAQAYVLNATVLPMTSLSYLTLWAAGGAQPDVSTLNANDGAITSNMAIVPTANGSVDAFSPDSTQLLLDLSSYFAP